MFTTVLYLLETYKLEGETENMGVCTKERKGVTAKELMGHSLYDDDVYYYIRWTKEQDGEWTSE